MEQPQSSFEGWAILEIFGHQRYAGYVTTQAFGQAVLFRVDVPLLGERERVTKHGEYASGGYVPPGATVKDEAIQGYTKFFGPGAIYAMTPCTQDAAEKALAAMQTRKVSLISLPPDAALPPASDSDEDELYNDAEPEEDDEEEEAG